MESYKKHRFERNPLEKEIHDIFIEEHGDKDISMIVYPPKNSGMSASKDLTEHEENIVVSTIQWLGSPVGQYFLEQCGFVRKDK